MNRVDIHPLEESLMEAIWIQWRSLGSQIDSEHQARTMVDPEALLLVSLALRHRERRLWDVLASWAKNGSQLFSLQRVKNLLNGYPDLTKDRLAEFAHRALEVGKDFRWQSLAGSDPGPTARNQDLWHAYPRLWQPSALVLRMRLGFGVGVAPDLISFLISLWGQWASARLIAQATNYSVYSVRRVADDVASAQLIESTQEKPVQYRAKVEAWDGLLGIAGEQVGWRFWHPIFSFAARVVLAEENGEWDSLSTYLVSTKLRDLVEEHREAFIWNKIDYPDPGIYPGEAYVPAFLEVLGNIAMWMKEQV